MHVHSNYSFKEGASEAWDLILTAKQLGIYALAITDHDNVSGVMEFAQAAKELGIKPIIGIELTLARGLGEPPETEHDPGDRPHITLLAETAAGYRNISLLTTRAHIDAEERNDPHLDPALLADHTEGVICLSGCRRGEISSLVAANDIDAARHAASRYIEVFGRDNFFLELHQNLVKGDTGVNRGMAALGREPGVGTVGPNHGHDPVPGPPPWSTRNPEGVREVKGRRLYRLPDRANEVLTTDAVVGR